MLYLLIFGSGFTGLIYEILWLRQLTLLFGSTSYATTTILSAFFAGIALGTWYWGKRAKDIRFPYKTYTKLEVSIGISAVLYLFLLPIYFRIYPLIFGNLTGGNSVLLFKFVLGFIILILPSFFMGGTLPVVSKLVKDNSTARSGSLVYFVNTLGGAFGILIAGFVLPSFVGLRTSYALTIIINLLIAYLAYQRIDVQAVSDDKSEKKVKTIKDRFIFIVIFVSGFAAISLEILWTVALSQVSLNDSYSFSAVLFIFILSIALGSYLSYRLHKKEIDELKVLSWLLVASGASVSISILVFNWLGFTPIAGSSWYIYLLSLFGRASAVILPPAVIMSIVFPYTLRLLSQGNRGELIGRWLLVNTLGAVAGSVLSGFFLVKAVGLWQAIGIMAGLYVLLAMYILFKREEYNNFALGIVSLFVVVIYIPKVVPVTHLKSTDDQELVDLVWSADSSLSVVSSHPQYYPDNFSDLYIRLNNNYNLGGLGALANERRQAHLPLILHGNPGSVFFLGMGTGITAGASLYHPVERVEVTEVVPEIVTLAQKYFAKPANDLFLDERVEVITVDARNYLFITDRKYDVIVGDLFEPWNPSAGSLYTYEHFLLVKQHLNEKGIFAQWLPLYQLTEKEFGIISNTFLKAFPNATLWRGNFVPDKPIVALVGTTDDMELDPGNFIDRTLLLNEQEKRVLIDYLISVKGLSIVDIDPESVIELTPKIDELAAKIPFTFYAGNLSENGDLFQDYQISTDNFPKINYLSARNANRFSGDKFTGERLLNFYSELLDNTPPDEDPYLKGLSSQQKEYVKAGLDYYKYNYYEFVGVRSQQDELIDKAKDEYDQYNERIQIDFESKN